MDWEDLPEEAQEAYEALGYSPTLWDEDGEASTEDAAWDELSAAEQEAATTLGYTATSWDAEEGETTAVASASADEAVSTETEETTAATSTDVGPEEETEETSAATVASADAEAVECSCSPTAFDLVLDLSRDCRTDTVEGTPGIGLVFCFLSSVRAGLTRGGGTLRQTTPPKVEYVTLDNDPAWKDADARYAKLDRDLGNTVVEEVLSVQFLEFDTSGTLLVINQDDTYEDVAFTDGQTVAFESVSATLDPDTPLAEQLDKVPGGAQLTLRGRAVNEDTGLETVVSVRLTWSYTHACDALALADGEELAWVTFDKITPAAEAFCPAAAPDATPRPTEALTEAPTPAPTGAPVAVPATDAPVAPTPPAPEPPSPTPPAPTPPSPTPPSPTPDASSSADAFSHSKASKSKALKEHGGYPKAEKSYKDPQAKAYKSSKSKSAKHEGSYSYDYDYSASSTKSGKALVDHDAKAEKHGSKSAKGKSSKGHSEYEPAAAGTGHDYGYGSHSKSSKHHDYGYGSKSAKPEAVVFFRP